MEHIFKFYHIVINLNKYSNTYENKIRTNFCLKEFFESIVQNRTIGDNETVEKKSFFSFIILYYISNKIRDSRRLRIHPTLHAKIKFYLRTTSSKNKAMDSDRSWGVIWISYGKNSKTHRICGPCPPECYRLVQVCRGTLRNNHCRRVFRRTDAMPYGICLVATNRCGRSQARLW